MCRLQINCYILCSNNCRWYVNQLNVFIWKWINHVINSTPNFVYIIIVSFDSTRKISSGRGVFTFICHSFAGSADRSLAWCDQIHRLTAPLLVVNPVIPPWSLSHGLRSVETFGRMGCHFSAEQIRLNKFLWYPWMWGFDMWHLKPVGWKASAIIDVVICEYPK